MAPPPWLNAMRRRGWRAAMPPVIIEAQARRARREAAGNTRGAGEGDAAGEAPRRRGEGADDALRPRGTQRVHENRGAELLRGGEDRLEARPADRRAVDVARQPRPGEAEFS